MQTPDMLVNGSGMALLAAFSLYCASFLLFVLGITGRGFRNRKQEGSMRLRGMAAFWTAVAGLGAHLFFFLTRWYAAGHIPVSNMYEFITFLAMMAVLASLLLFWLYRALAVGAFALPVAIVLLAYAYVFPKEITPLIPALKSHWLTIHVTLAAAGEAFFAVGFALGLMYLLRTLDYSSSSSQTRRQKAGVEVALVALLAVLGFAGIYLSFQVADRTVFEWESRVTDRQTGLYKDVTVTSVYILPPVIAPAHGSLKEGRGFLGREGGLVRAPEWMKGVQAGRKLNSAIWSFLAAGVLYGAIWLLARKPLGAILQPLVKELDQETLDEMAYRSIAIGYPVFTLGGLVFAMIWAHEAWGRFWGWDPKEVWALVTWLFYTAYLHLRLSAGWQGQNSAWLAVAGFLIVMFTLVGVNLVISGLHSYA